MFRRRKTSSRAHDVQPAQQRNDTGDSSGKDIQARIAQLRNVPREKLADAVFMLSMAAKSNDPVALMRTVGTVSGVVCGLGFVMIVIGLIGKKV